MPVPLFVTQGDTDVLVKPALTWQFADRECGLGTRVTRLAIPATGHGEVALRALPTVLPWFATVESGALPALNC
jgi:hypothetical protein